MVAQDDSDRLVGKRGVIGARLAIKHEPRSCKGVLWPRQREQRETQRLRRQLPGRISRRHANDARQFPTSINIGKRGPAMPMRRKGPERPHSRLEAQINLILQGLPHSAAWPPDWDEKDKVEVDYLYRRGSILCRDSDVERVQRA